MLSEADRRIAEELRQRLSGIVPVLELKVFGSRARGEAEPDSDMDVFIKVPGVDPVLLRRISDLAWEVGFANDRVITTVVVTPEQLETGPIGADPLMLNIEREGVRV